MNWGLERFKFRVALWLWARWLPVLAYRRDLKSLIDHAMPRCGTPYGNLTPAYVAKRARRAVHKPWFMRDRPCLREGLLAYRFLVLAGYRPELHFGVEETSIPASRLSAHCWVVLDGRTILNESANDIIEVLIVRSGADGLPKLDAVGADSAWMRSTPDATLV